MTYLGTRPILQDELQKYELHHRARIAIKPGITGMWQVSGRMNILYIAYSCNPFAGSEDKIGWCVPYESSKTNKVYVITKEEQREPVEKYLQSHPLENIKFYYVDIPNFYKKIFKGFMYSGRLNVWNRRVLPLANHVHLLLETDDIEIGKFMKYMSECYAIYYNHKYGYRGHVFESRYKSCLVKEDAYFLQTSRYIHLNPVKAQMADYPEDYLWSSYRTMIGITDDGIIEKKKTLAYFPKNSIYQYREFVEDIGHKYIVQEQHIRKMIGEDELWLPW